MKLYERNCGTLIKITFLHKTNKRSLVLTILLILFLSYFWYVLDPQGTYVKFQIEGKRIVLDSALVTKSAINSKSIETHRSSCQMPKLSPGTQDIYDMDYNQFESMSHGVPPDCFNNNSTMFAIDYESNLIRLNFNSSFWEDSKCYYRPYYRDPDRPDFKFLQDPELYPITQEKTKLPPDMENIMIRCNTSNSKETIFEDYLSHVPIKVKLEMTLENLLATQNPENYPSILIFGQDSTSHMNFRRHMPQAHNFLLNEMEAVQFNGFNSLGDGTLWSLFPFFTGLDFNEFNQLCHSNKSDYFDSCPMIWKEFRKLGYRTSYAEDAVGLGIFNSIPYPGFSRQPVDYDFRSVTKLLKKVMRGHNVGRHAAGCYGSRLTFDVLLENLLKTAHTFSKLNKPFFHFSWTSELTHNINYYSKFGEELLLKALRELHYNKLLSNTVLILMSDHGMRYGKMRQTTRQGFLEERLPLLYIVLPDSLKKRFPSAYGNMKGNSEKLITTFDLYSTMKDLMNISSLEATSILEREAEYIGGMDDGRRRDVSLFLPINENRTCSMIGFASIYCACMSRSSIPVEDPFIRQVAQVIVESINTNLTGHPQCDQLTLGNVTTAVRLDAQISTEMENARFGQTGTKEVAGLTYEIGFETSPGGGVFYSSIFQNSDSSEITVSSINRISAYGNDAHCMDIKELWPFCHCKN